MPHTLRNHQVVLIAEDIQERRFSLLKDEPDRSTFGMTLQNDSPVLRPATCRSSIVASLMTGALFGAITTFFPPRLQHLDHQGIEEDLTGVVREIQDLLSGSKRGKYRRAVPPQGSVERLHEVALEAVLAVCMPFHAVFHRIRHRGDPHECFQPISRRLVEGSRLAEQAPGYCVASPFRRLMRITHPAQPLD